MRFRKLCLLGGFTAVLETDGVAESSSRFVAEMQRSESCFSTNLILALECSCPWARLGNFSASSSQCGSVLW